MIQRISPLVGGVFSVESVRLGFLSVYLSGVKVSIPLRSFFLHVPDMKVGISLARLLASGFDLSRSISKIIFVHPSIDIVLGAGGTGLAGDTSPARTASLQSLPLQHLLVQGCIVRLLGSDGDTTVLGEQLTGRLWAGQEGVQFELHGKLASRRRNLHVSGVLSRTGGNHRVLMEIDKARIGKPLAWRDLTVTGGMLEGICEVTFSDTLSLANTGMNGRLRIRDGRGVVGSMKQPIRGVALTISVDGSTLALDSLAAEWRDARLSGSGQWDLWGPLGSSVLLTVRDIDPRVCMPELPRYVRESFVGGGWSNLRISRDKGGPMVGWTFCGGGFSLCGKPITVMSGRGEWGDRHLSIDTLLVKTSSASLFAHGTITPGARWKYTMSCRGRCSAGDLFPGWSGDLAMTGNLCSGKDTHLASVLLETRGLSAFAIPLGSPGFALLATDEAATVSTVAADTGYVTLSGVINGLRDDPQLDLRLDARGASTEALVARLPNVIAREIAGGRISLTVTGSPEAPAVDGIITCSGRKVSGKSLVALRAVEEAEGVYRWQLRGDKVYVSGLEFPLLAEGTISQHELVLDTVAAMTGMSAKGRMSLGSASGVSLSVMVDGVSLANIDAWFSGGGKLLTGGTLSGTARVLGTFESPEVKGRLRVRDAAVVGISDLGTDVVFNANDGTLAISPFVMHVKKRVVASIGTLRFGRQVEISGELHDVALSDLVGEGALPDGTLLAGSLSGRFATGDSGLPVEATVETGPVAVGNWRLDSVSVQALLTGSGVELVRAVGHEAEIVVEGCGYAPWSFFSGRTDEGDTMTCALRAEGDLLAWVARNFDSPIGGKGKGVVDVELSAASEDWQVLRANLVIPEGVLTLRPFVPEEIKGFTLRADVDDSSRLDLALHGRINRRPITIRTSHTVPAGYESLKVGPLDFGIVEVFTPEGGVDLHLLGFLDIGEIVNVEFAPRPPFGAFALCGPPEKLKIAGTWVLRNTEFTYPLLEKEELPWDFDPTPYVEWELDLRAGNRNVKYYYDAGPIRFVTCVVDPAETKVEVRGRMHDQTFRLYGGAGSYRGEAFYGRVFDRNFELGLDFVPEKLPDGKGYNNLPMVWGSVEAFSDSSRFDRIALTLLTRDPETGALAEKGRFNEIAFRVSSDFEEMPGVSERELFREAGLEFTSLKGAGGLVSAFGDQYIKKYFLQRLERRLARRLGLDVISFETAIASNYFSYFYDNRLDNLVEQWNYLAFANVGITVGRYFLRDRFFLKWRTALTPGDSLLLPEHSIGIEYMPARFFWLDFDYGFRREDDVLVYNPKLQMQLRLPIGGFRKALDF